MISGLYLRIAGIAVIVLSVLGAWWYVQSLRGEIEELSQEKLTLQVQLTTQNAAVDALRREAEERMKETEQLIAIAREQALKASKRATIIYKTRPSDPANDCKSALDLINSTGAEEAAALDMINGSKK